MLLRTLYNRTVYYLTLIVFITGSTAPSVSFAGLNPAEYLNLPIPGVMLAPTGNYAPLSLKGLMLHPEDAFKFDFIMDTGNSRFDQQGLHDEALKLMKYFLTSLTIPEEDLWVNLSPYERNRIVETDFGKTLMGRDLLSEDYVLKQLTASLIYPENNLGRTFWSKVYQKAQEKYGTTQIPVNTFNKVWIVPSEAVVWEHGGKVMILKSHLKVMLEEDYLSLTKHMNSDPAWHRKGGIYRIGSDIVRTLVIPVLEKEVNEGAHFSQLRQMYQAMILATWFKKELKNNILYKIYADRKAIKGVDARRIKDVEYIYRQYLQAFKKGMFNYIKEDIDPATGQISSKKYFSGGFVLSGATNKKGLKTFALSLTVLHLAFKALSADEQSIIKQQPVGKTVLVTANVSAYPAVSSKKNLQVLSQIEVEKLLKTADVYTNGFSPSLDRLINSDLKTLEERLLWEVRHGKNKFISAEAVRVLKMLRPVHVLDELVDYVKETAGDESKSYVRLNVIELIIDLGASKDVLSALLHTPLEDNERTEIIFSLARTADDTTVDELLRQLKNARDKGYTRVTDMQSAERSLVAVYNRLGADRFAETRHMIIKALVAALEDDNIARFSAQKLNELKWKPETVREKVRYYLACQDTESIVRFGKGDTKSEVINELESLLRSTNGTNSQVKMIKDALNDLGVSSWITLKGSTKDSIKIGGGLFSVFTMLGTTYKLSQNKLKIFFIKWGNPGTAQEYLSDPNAVVRIAAIEEIGKSSSFGLPAVMILRRILTDDPDPVVRKKVENILLNGSKVTINYRIKISAEMNELRMRINDPSVKEPQLTLDIMMRKAQAGLEDVIAAVNLIGEIFIDQSASERTKGINILKDLSNDPEKNVRNAANKAIAELADRAMLQKFPSNLGGISLDAKIMDLKVKGIQNRVDPSLGGKSFNRLHIDGFIPVIVAIRLIDLKSFLKIIN